MTRPFFISDIAALSCRGSEALAGGRQRPFHVGWAFSVARDRDWSDFCIVSTPGNGLNDGMGNARDADRKSRPVQFFLLLLVSVAVGIGYNYLSPRGLSLQTPGGEPVSEGGVEVGRLDSRGEQSLPPYEHQGEVSEDGFPVVEWMDVKNLVDRHGALLVDARPQWAFDAGHIPHAVCLPFSFESTDLEKAFVQDYPAERNVVIYCGDPSCERSKYLAKKLRDQFNFQSLFVYEQGYEDFLQQSR